MARDYALVSSLLSRWLDWHYQLISPTPCLFLFFLGLFGAHQGISTLTLSQSLESAVCFFSVFLYHLLFV